MLVAATVHFPYMTAFPDRAPAADRETTMAGARTLGDAFRDAGVRTIVCFTSEHIVNLQPRLAPPFLIGTGARHEAFPEPHFNLEPIARPGDPELADAIVRALYAEGFDIAHASEVRLDHGTTLPLATMAIEPEVALVPIVVNSIFAPLPSLERCRRLGAAVARAVAGSGLGREVGILATGGLSHTVGAPGVDANDPAFDADFVGALLAGDLDRACRHGDAVLDAIGNGTHEIRNWIAAAAAAEVAGSRAPVAVTGLPFVAGWNSGVHQMLWSRA